MVTVPVVARVTGLDGTVWRSDLSLTNREDVPIDVLLRYQPTRDSVLTQTLTLASFQTMLFQDPVKELFGAGGRGAVRIETLTRDVVEPAVASRTIAERESGNLGQGISGVVNPQPDTCCLAGLQHGESFRSNIAVTAGADSDVSATFILYTGDAKPVAESAEHIVPAGQQRQWSFEKLFPDYPVLTGPATVSARLSSSAIVYVSIVDNISTDGVTILGRVPQTSWVVPVVARAPGKNDTYWTSDVAIANVSPSYADLSLEYLPENTDNMDGGIVKDRIRLRPGQLVYYTDVVDDLFGVEEGKGTLRIESTAKIVASSRVSTPASGGGTIGHGVQTVTPAALNRETKVLSGVRLRQGFRTNVGVVTGEHPASVRLRLFDHDGVLQGETYVDVPGRSMAQWSVDTLFGKALLEKPDPAGGLVVDADTDFFAYLVTIDNSSQDPVLFLPEH